MQISAEGLAHLKHWEGVRTEVYVDAAGLPTIGVGHQLTKDELSSGKIYIGHHAVRYFHGLTLHEVDELLVQDLARYTQFVDRAVEVSVNQAQYDVLVSFTYNVGTCALRRSTLLLVLNRGEHENVPHQLRRWVHVGGRRCQGLVLRRAREAEIWIRGYRCYSGRC